MLTLGPEINSEVPMLVWNCLSDRSRPEKQPFFFHIKGSSILGNQRTALTAMS